MATVYTVIVRYDNKGGKAMSYVLAFLLGASMFCMYLSVGAIEKGHMKSGLIMALISLVVTVLLIKPINRRVGNEKKKRCKRYKVSKSSY